MARTALTEQADPRGARRADEGAGLGSPAPAHRLVQAYRRDAVVAAVDRATRYRNWSGQTVSRILEAAHPDVMPELPLVPLRGDPAVLGTLGEVDTGDLRAYTLDTMPPTTPSDPDSTKKRSGP